MVTFAGIAAAAEPAATPAGTTNDVPRFDIQSYVIRSDPSIFPNVRPPALSTYTGTNVSLDRVVQAASDVLFEFQKQGYTNANIAIAKEAITNGVVTMNVFKGVFPQVLISGRQRFRPGETAIATAGATNAPSAATNAPVPKFAVLGYEIQGNTLLSDQVLNGVLAKHTGTNLTLEDLKSARDDLQAEYFARKYPTVGVTLPPQKLTNGILRMEVTEGVLAEINVRNNHYFSSNNVMRSLPSLQTNTILNGAVFQAELDRANANRNRQIYPQVAPGPEPGTTGLTLKVEDVFPLHAKTELDNFSSPGTPELRVNSSAVYENLWQKEHSLGVQYSFSPETYKFGDQWNFYDKPLVANYSGFYRMPLGEPTSLSEVIGSNPGNFGWDEGSRKFRLPPPSGGAELNLYASRSVIDTGVEDFPSEVLFNVPGVREVTRQDSQEDLTLNETLGFRLTEPLEEFSGIRSTVSAGFDYKQYRLTSSKTNNFVFSEIFLDQNGNPLPPQIRTIPSPVPVTYKKVQYIPFNIKWDASRPDKTGQFDFSLGYTPQFLNPVFPNNDANFENAAGSSHATGYYHILNGSLSRDQLVYHGWRLVLHADGQWANQPLIATEQFGIGGQAGPRGYREGEVFGDNGWRITLEQKTPPHVVGMAYGKNPLTLRASAFMDYGEVFLLDPNGRDARTPLWGVGFGVVAAVGPHWEARMLLSWPLLRTSTTEADQPRLNFALTGQF